jgi:hypothetical protein
MSATLSAMSDPQRKIPSQATKVTLAGYPDRHTTSEHTRLPDHRGTLGSGAGTSTDPHKAFDLFPAAPPLPPPAPGVLPAPASPSTARSRVCPPVFDEPCDPTRLTDAGADWLASASAFPESVHALWRHRPTSPSVLPCGTVFDVVSTAPLLGRRLLDRLWSVGPGSGPVAVHRDRLLLFTAPGTAHRLPALLGWGEWRAPFGSGTGDADAYPPLLCHGPGDIVTIPAPQPPPCYHGDPRKALLHEHDHPEHQHREHPHPHRKAGLHEAGHHEAGHHEAGLHERGLPGRTGQPHRPDHPHHESPSPDRSRWLVAPDVRHPWLPGPDDLLWACVHAYRTAAPASPHAQHPTPPVRFRAGRGPSQHRRSNFRNPGS